MTNILLSIIAVLLFARIVLQVRQVKRAVEKGYAAPSEVENVHIMIPRYQINTYLSNYSKEGYELVSVVYLNEHDMIQLFFTRKKIKSNYEE